MNTAIKVSIYEANVNFLESLSFLICRTEGFELCSASPYTVDILAECHDNYPDVILMDIDMPEQAGIEATRLVKEVYPDINIMMLTVFERTDKIFEALCAGATGYMLKKSPSEQIIETIKELVHGGSPINSNIARKTLEYFLKPAAPKKNESFQISLHETEVLKRFVMGDSYKMVSDACSVSIGTVYSDINNLYRKLYDNTKPEVVSIAQQEQLTYFPLSSPENIPDFGHFQ